MEGGRRMNGPCQRLQDMLSGVCFGGTEEQRLELRLGLPGDLAVKENQNNHSSREMNDESLLSLGYLAKSPTPAKHSSGAKRGFSDADGEEDGLKEEIHKLERRGLSPALAPLPGNPGAPTNSQKRTDSAPVVGWPPIRSFRKNIAGGSSKSGLDSKNGVSQVPEKTEKGRKAILIKIYMDGIPIGRKVDLQVYDSYEKLSSAADELFRGLLQAQRDSSTTIHTITTGEKHTTEAVLEGSGKYTLVYEDNEGDRMLVGDVPWNMFLTSVRRLRVLKSSDVSAMCPSRYDKAFTDSRVR